jgi:tetratricopeptide (TPR) repeat protein
MPKWEKCAEVEAQRALALAPELAEAHEAMAAVHRWSDFDWEGTIQESDRALELNPSLHTPHRLRADSFRHLGLLDLVEREVQNARENDPGGPRDESILATITLLEGRYAEAVQQMTTPKGMERHYYSPQALFFSGETRRAIELAASMHAPDMAGRRLDALRASLLAASRKQQEAEQALAPLLTREYRDHHLAYSVGAAYAQLQNIREAVRWLRLSAEWGYVCYPWYSRDPLLKPLDTDPEFRQFLMEMRKTWEANKARFGSHAAAGVR